MTDTATSKVRKPRYTGEIGLNFDAAQQDTVDMTQTRPGAGRPKQDLTPFVKILTANYKTNAQNRKQNSKTRVGWVNQCAKDAFSTVKSKFSQAGRECTPPLGCTFKILSETDDTVQFALVAGDRVTGRGRKPKSQDTDSK